MSSAKWAYVVDRILKMVCPTLLSSAYLVKYESQFCCEGILQME